VSHELRSASIAPHPGGPIGGGRLERVLAPILAARQLADLGDLPDSPCQARDVVLKNAIQRAEMILRKIEQMYEKPG
jgi:hypothetical protein